MKWWLRFGHTRTLDCVSLPWEEMCKIYPPLPSWIMRISPHVPVLIYSFLPFDIKHNKHVCSHLHVKSCNYHNKIAIFNTNIIQKSHSKNPHSPASWGSPWMFWRKGTLTKSNKKTSWSPMWFSQELEGSTTQDPSHHQDKVLHVLRFGNPN